MALWAVPLGIVMVAVVTFVWLPLVTWMDSLQVEAGVAQQMLNSLFSTLGSVLRFLFGWLVEPCRWVLHALLPYNPFAGVVLWDREESFAPYGSILWLSLQPAFVLALLPGLLAALVRKKTPGAAVGFPVALDGFCLVLFVLFDLLSAWGAGASQALGLAKVEWFISVVMTSGFLMLWIFIPNAWNSIVLDNLIELRRQYEMPGLREASSAPIIRSLVYVPLGLATVLSGFYLGAALGHSWQYGLLGTALLTGSYVGLLAWKGKCGPQLVV